MKRTSKGLIAFGLAGTLLLNPVSSYAENDDIVGHYFENDMRTLIEKEIMKGYGEGVFMPEKNVTRAEFATFLARALQLPAADSNFADVPSTYVLYDGISKAAGASIIQGRGDNKFDPDENVTREEMAIMVMRSLVYKNINVELAPLNFVDKDQIMYPEYVQFVVGAGIIKGYEDNTFRPTLPATRGVAAAYINRMLQVIENGGATIPEVEKLYVLTNVSADGKEEEKGRYSTYEEAIAAAQASGTKAVKYKDEYVWIQDGYAVAKKTEGNKINLYKNDLTSVTNYVSYGTELKVASIEGDAVKVQLSNTEGYVKKEEVMLFPSEVMKLSSYYVNSQDGYLYHRYYNHYASKPDYTGYRYGKAPSSLKPGQFVYSIDGKTFGEETFYQYFNYISLRTKTEYTAEELDKYVQWRKPDSPLIGLGKAFKEAESKYNVNALFLYSLAIHESEYGTSKLAKEKNNLFGLNATDANPHEDAKKYDSKEACIMDAAKAYMNEGYLNPKHWRYNAPYTGNKAFGLNVKYASDPYWGQKIAGHMFRFDTYLGGKEYNSYQLAKVLTQTEVEKNPNQSNETLYSVRPDMVVTVVGEETIGGQAWLQVISDDPSVTIGYIAKGNVEYVAH